MKKMNKSIINSGASMYLEASYKSKSEINNIAVKNKNNESPAPANFSVT
jgi:hypothetical protein